MSIVVHSIDFDGCLYHASCQWGDNIVEKNKDFLDVISKRANGAKQIVFLGSNRQSIHTELLNSLYQLHGIQSRLDKNYSFQDIQLVSAALGATFDPFLLADVYSKDPEGHDLESGAAHKMADEFQRQAGWKYHTRWNEDGTACWEETIEGDAYSTHPAWVFDDTKLTILYAQMQKVAFENPNEAIQFEFYDDRNDGGNALLEPLHAFFCENPQLIPHNVTLQLNHFYGDVNSLNPYPPIIGIGAINPDYRATVKEMAAQVSDTVSPVDGDTDTKIASLFDAIERNSWMLPFHQYVNPNSLSFYQQANADADAATKVLNDFIITSRRTCYSASYDELIPYLDKPWFPDILFTATQKLNQVDRWFLLINLMNGHYSPTYRQKDKLPEYLNALIASIESGYLLNTCVDGWITSFFKQIHSINTAIEIFYRNLHAISFHNPALANDIFCEAERIVANQYPANHKRFIDSMDGSTEMSQWFKQSREAFLKSIDAKVQTVVQEINGFSLNLAKIPTCSIQDAFRSALCSLGTIKTLSSPGEPVRVSSAQAQLIEQAYSSKINEIHELIESDMNRRYIRDLGNLAVSFDDCDSEKAFNERVEELRRKVLDTHDFYAYNPVLREPEFSTQEVLTASFKKHSDEKISEIEHACKDAIAAAVRESTATIGTIMHRYQQARDSQTLIEKDKEQALLEVRRLKGRFADLDRNILQFEMRIEIWADKASLKLRRQQEIQADLNFQAYKAELYKIPNQPKVSALLDKLAQHEKAYVNGDYQESYKMTDFTKAYQVIIKQADIDICANKKLREALIDALDRYRKMRAEGWEYRGVSFFGSVGWGFSKTTKLESVDALLSILKGNTPPDAALLERYRAVYCDKRLNVEYLQKTLDGHTNCPYKDVGTLIDAIGDGSFSTFGRLSDNDTDRVSRLTA